MARISGKNSQEIRTKMPRAIYDAYLELHRALWAEGRLDVPLREMLRLKSAELAGCVH